MGKGGGGGGSDISIMGSNAKRLRLSSHFGGRGGRGGGGGGRVRKSKNGDWVSTYLHLLNKTTPIPI